MYCDVAQTMFPFYNKYRTLHTWSSDGWGGKSQVPRRPGIIWDIPRCPTRYDYQSPMWGGGGGGGGGVEGLQPP